MKNLSRSKKVGLILGVVLLVFSVAFLTFDTATPGTALYSGKRSIESLRESLVFTNQGKAEFNLMIATKRMDEAELLVVRGDQDEVHKALEEEKVRRDLGLRYAEILPDEDIVNSLLDKSEDLRIRALELRRLLREQDES